MVAIHGTSLADIWKLFSNSNQYYTHQLKDLIKNVKLYLQVNNSCIDVYSTYFQSLLIGVIMGELMVNMLLP